jgi:hypothetical protein
MIERVAVGASFGAMAVRAELTARRVLTSGAHRRLAERSA